MSAYDRIDIIVGGKQKLTARPVDFIYDNKGRADVAIKYETTCPNCGHMVVFQNSDIVIRNDEKYVGCNSCNKGFIKSDEVPEIIDDSSIEVKASGQIIEKQIVVVDERGCPFLDPVEQGNFDPSTINK